MMLRNTFVFKCALLIALGPVAGCIPHDGLLLTEEDQPAPSSPVLRIVLHGEKADFVGSVDTPLQHRIEGKSKNMSLRPVEIFLRISAENGVTTESTVELNLSQFYVESRSGRITPQTVQAFVMKPTDGQFWDIPKHSVDAQDKFRFDAPDTNYLVKLTFDTTYNTLERGALHLEGVLIDEKPSTVKPIHARYGGYPRPPL